MGSYDHHEKYQGVFQDLLYNTFFPLNSFKFSFPEGGAHMKKGAKETHPDIFRGGHRNPYQLENAIKSVGTVFLHI